MHERSPDIYTESVLAGLVPERPVCPVDLGNEPPLDPSGLTAPRRDRRGVSVRWLSGSVLTGLSGVLLLGAAIYVSLESDAAVLELPETAILKQAVPVGIGDKSAVSTRRGDRLVRSDPVLSAKQSFKSPVTLRIGQREVIKVRPFVRIATALSLTSGQYASDIPRFNPLKLFDEDTDQPERTAEAAPDASDAEVSLVKHDLGPLAIPADAPALSDAEAAAQVEEQRRLSLEAGKRPALPLPAQLMLSRSLRQPGLPNPALAYADPVEAPFSKIEVRVVPENVTVLSKTEPNARESFSEERAVVMKRGESLEQLLRANGASDDQIRSILGALWTKVKVSALGEGQRVRLLVAPGPQKSDERQIVRVMLVGDTAIEAIAAIDDRGVFVSVAPPQGDDATVTGKPIAEDEEEEDSGSGITLYESLYETAIKNDLPKSVVEELIRVFAYDVDFQRHVSVGDSFELFYAEDEDNPGRLEVLYAALNVNGDPRRIYRFQSPEDGAVDYFDQDGKSLKKFLLRKPIAEAVMRSGFGMRYHPILHYSKMHTGVDWANKVGTPILAAGNGVVSKAGWTSGYGKHTEIEHANGYVTTYSHQSAFARGIVPGARVRQGQVIGYVGSTGLSTGPHLHFEVLVNGHYVNPMKIKVPRGRELEGRSLAEFKRQKEQVDQLLAKAGSTKVAQDNR